MFVEITKELVVNVSHVVSIECTNRGDKTGLDKEPDEVEIVMRNEENHCVDVDDFDVLKARFLSIS